MVRGKPVPMRCPGWQPYLTPEEEQALVDSISRHQDANMPLTRVQVSIMVMRIVARLPRSNPGVQKWIECGRPSNKWFQGFLQRHPDLSLRRAVDSEAAEAEAAAAKNTIVQQAAEVPVPQPREAVASESSDDDACTDSEVEEEQEEAEQRDVAATVACMVDAVAAEVQAAAVTATAAAATAVTVWCCTSQPGPVRWPAAVWQPATGSRRHTVCWAVRLHCSSLPAACSPPVRSLRHGLPAAVQLHIWKQRCLPQYTACKRPSNQSAAPAVWHRHVRSTCRPRCYCSCCRCSQQPLWRWWGTQPVPAAAACCCSHTAAAAGQPCYRKPAADCLPAAAAVSGRPPCSNRASSNNSRAGRPHRPGRWPRRLWLLCLWR
mmetsp:Transcript_19966/g.43470  ORF Transcript_19966/g.43470 Transcript_19966/m.43470 type:complete len:376 (-) Transcript_19966:3267-4394(-)